MTHELAFIDLAHAIRHAAPDEPTEDADGYVTWNGRSRDAMDTSAREDR